MKYVAVYGTLRRGHGNHRLMEGAECVAEGFFSLPYRMVSLSAFPGLVAAIEPHRVYLEVYEVDDSRLNRLDGLEGYRGDGHNNFYSRVNIPDLSINGQVVQVYVLDSSYNDHPQVDSGDWVAYRKGA